MFKIGDSVTIRYGLIDEEMYGNEIFIEDSMIDYCGMTGTIVKEATLEKSWNLDIDGGDWAWSNEMLDPQKLDVIPKTEMNIPVHAEPITDWREAFQDMVFMFRWTVNDDPVVDEIREKIINRRTK